MKEIVEVEEIIADVVAFITAVQIEGTENPSNEAILAASLLLAVDGLDEDSEEYSIFVATLYALHKMDYLNVVPEILED